MVASVVVRGLAEHRVVSGILRGGEGVVSPHDAETGAVGGVGLDCSLERAHLEPVQFNTRVSNKQRLGCLR